MTDVYNFGSSPFLDDVLVDASDNSLDGASDDGYSNTVHGGEVGLKNSKIFMYVVIALLVILVVYLVYIIAIRVRIGGEDYNQRQAHNYFNNLHGEQNDKEAKLAVKYGEAIENPRAIDHYRLGTTLLINANEPRKAHHHFTRALEMIIGGEVDMREVPFILDRIDDYKDRFVDFPDIEELPLQHAILAHYENKTNFINNMANQPVANDDPAFVQKTLLSRQHWQSESQNVHDSAMTQEFSDQINKVRNENGQIPNIALKDYNDVKNWLKVRYKNEPENLTKITKVLDMLDNNYDTDLIPNGKEKDILVNVWRRSYDAGNQERFNDIREAIGDSLLDCVEGNMVVCKEGRSKKVWQALATLDKDPEIGILKSKQALRNEIYERAAKIVDDYVGANGTASDALKESYINDEKSEQVKEITECMKKQIIDMKKDYENRLPNDQLDLVMAECISNV